MATSPRGRSGTVNKKDIIIYEDEAYADDLPHLISPDKVSLDADAEEPVKRESITSCDPTGRTSLFGEGEKLNDLYPEEEHDVNQPKDWPRSSIMRQSDLFEGNDRNVSSNTAIHLLPAHTGLRGSDPFVEEEHDEDVLEELYEESSGNESDDQDDERFEDEADHFDDYGNNNSRVTSIESGTRKPSDFSTLPEEVNPLPFAPTPPNWREHGSYRASNSARTSPARSTNRLLSSPQSSGPRHFSPAAAQTKDGRFVSSPLARQQHSSAFRNPSSVREMQLSSPSPPPAINQTPRSARQRRLDQDMANSSPHNGTPSRNPGVQSSRVPSNIGTPMTPSRNPHPNPQKEYPLVLLHCSFSAPPLPYSSAVLRTVLPEPLQESVMLLREKLGPTVMERGILVPHPQDDYELLEERVLESLELKTPRVGKCGHFIGSDSRKSSGATERQNVTLGEASAEQDGLHPKCKTCDKHVTDDHRGCLGDNQKRWDLRVYASNGLMRAGAWATAWREMEKVDIEITVWLPEDVRFALEREAQLELERDGADAYYDGDMSGDHPGFSQPPADGSGSVNDGPRSAYGKSDPVSASTAACSRTTSRSKKQYPREREPLSTLLLRYFERNFLRRTDLLLHVVVVVIALAFFMQWRAKPPLHDDLSNPSPNISMDLPEVSIMKEPTAAAAVAQQAEVVSTSFSQLETVATKTITEFIEATIPACSFAAGQEAQFGLTAVPADVAKKVLLAAESTASIHQEIQSPYDAINSEEKEDFGASLPEIKTVLPAGDN